MGEQFVYLIKLLKDDYELPHVEAFIDKDVADFHYKKDLIYYRRQGWEIEEDNNVCGVYVTNRAAMRRMTKEGPETATLLMERYEITKN
jgi:hypothetical protein